MIPTSRWIALELDLHLLAQLEVEGAERLVEQQDLRVVDDRAREGDALTLAAGELCRLPGAETAEAHHLERFRCSAATLPLPDLLHHEPVLDVLLDRHVREERVVLEDGVHRPVVRRQPGHVLAGELDRALVRRLEAGDHPQGRRLARPRGPEHREELPRRDVEVDRIHRDDVSVALA